MKLSPKQERFCKEYLIDLNATQAAIRSGYSEKTAKVQGSRLLTKADISARVGELREKQSERLEITADRVLKEWGKIAFDDKQKSADRLHGLDSIAKHLGMFTNKEIDPSGLTVVFRSVLDPKP